ncbi:MAG: hypothetical protein ABI234_15985 [Ktedonobacteraceae bacterium]
MPTIFLTVDGKWARFIVYAGRQAAMSSRASATGVNDGVPDPFGCSADPRVRRM